MKSFLLLPFIFLFMAPAAFSQQERHNIGPDKFQRLMKKKKARVLDVRTTGEYSSGHIPGATNLDVNQEDFTSLIRNLDRNKIYLLYCQSGRRSERALQIMRAEGFTRVYHLRDGFESWEGETEKP